ncbi:hypothetical protein MHU86_4369 [Fragilaria crotonensis]|nr:hypothetical protein MHU86_4369 [Fragilaria crotonensis]
MTQELRNRKKKKRSSSTTNESQGETPVADPVVEPNDESEEESLWQTFTSHPLIKVMPIVLVPYLLFHAYFFIRLQHPEYLGVGWLRPAVGLTEERQFLIVGTMSSGIDHVAKELVQNFQGLEVIPEASDAWWYFARDGTVSWFHGIRFLRPPKTLEPVANFCFNFTGHMGFHPTNYRSNSGCSSRSKWDRCWAKECILLVDREWGCAVGSNDELFGKSCETPFRKTLHQVRHPLRTVESLVTKFCVGGIDGQLDPDFLKFMLPLFTSLSEQDSCIEAAVKYVLEYTLAMLDARKKGLIAGMYQIETATPCDIVEMAGLTTPNDVVYAPNLEKVATICSQPFHKAKSPMEPKVNEKKKKARVSLEWKDLRGGVHRSNRTDDDLGDALKALTLQLGYELNMPKVTTLTEF